MMCFIAFSFGHALVAIKADHEAAEHFVCHRGPSTKDSETEIVIFMLIDFEVYSIVTYSLSEN